ncbi:MAG: hypothetical protein AB1746_05920 [Candidatus Zixiibacteriota bacterium]
MKKSLLIIILLLIIIAVIIWLLICREPAEIRPPTLLTNGSGVETTEFQIHETILLDAVNLEPRAGYDIKVTRDDGITVTELRLSTNAQGRIPETVLWYNVGVLPCPRIIGTTRMVEYEADYDLTDYSFAGRNYTLSFIQKSQIVREITFHVAAAVTRPVLYACNAWGCPKSGFLIGEENVWVAGRNFPKGSIIRLWAVDASSDWKAGDNLADRTKLYGYGLPVIFELKPDETSFKKLLWPKGLTSVGSYDIVAEVVTYEFGEYRVTATANVTNVVSNLTYSGFVVQRRPGVAEPLEVDIAGSLQSPFTFRNTFLTTEDVYVGVDPCLQPSYVGQTADIYIVADKSDAQWTTSTAVALNTLDVTGVIETITVGGICGNCWKTLAWSAPLTVGQYDVVLDFDRDGFYTPGIDLIDALDPVGFIVAEVRVDNISFNYGGAGAITIYDNVAGANITAPEYYSANHIVKPAAWVRGGSHSVRVEFKAVSGVNNIQVWAENGLGGLNSSGSPVTITFTAGSGTGTFSVNSPPSVIGKSLFYWDWKYKNVNGASTPTTEMGETGEHVLYAINATPNAPMATPWVDVLEYATNWASGQTTEAGVVSGIISGIYYSGMVYDGGGHHTTSYGNFNLSGVFSELKTGGMTVYMDCRDCANFFHVLTNALGFNHEYLRIPGYFDYLPILAMGHGSCLGGGWNYHQVGWCGAHVADGSAKMSCTILAVCDYSATDYINLLTATPGITAGITDICSPY